MRKTYIILILLLLIIFPSYLVLRKKVVKKENYAEVRVERKDIVSTLRINGTVEPRNRLPIKPQVAGRVEEILVTEGQKVKKGDILAWLSSTERAALLDIAKAQGEQEYKKWQEIYKPTPVIAPLDGFIIVRNKEPGQTVTTNDTIVVMADELIVKANVDETDLRYVKLNQLVSVSLDAYPDIRFKGVIEHIAYESNVVNNVTVYEVKIKPIFGGDVRPSLSFRHSVPEEIKTKFAERFGPRSGWTKPDESAQHRIKPVSRSYFGENLADILRSGMSATVEIISQQKKNVLVLPKEAVIDTGKEKYVLVKNNKKPEKRVVQTGVISGPNIEIISGLEEGEIVLYTRKEYQKKTSSGFAQQSVRRDPMSAFFRR